MAGKNNEPTVCSLLTCKKLLNISLIPDTMSIPDILIMSKQVFDAALSQKSRLLFWAAQETIPLQHQIWADYVGEATAQLKEKGMEFNEVDDITAFQALAAPIASNLNQLSDHDLVRPVMDAGK